MYALNAQQRPDTLRSAGIPKRTMKQNNWHNDSASFSGIHRRGLLGALAAATVGVVGGPAYAGSPANADVAILNYLLNFEYLEAEFLLRAVFGRGLSPADSSGVGVFGHISGGRAARFKPGSSLRDYFSEMALNDEAHVKFLRSLLGSSAVARPSLDIDQSFRRAMVISKIVANQDAFDPYDSERNLLLSTFLFKDAVASAYAGIIRYIETKELAEAVASIFGAEAHHAACIRVLLHENGFLREARLISNLRDLIDGPNELDQPIRKDGMTNFVPTDKNGALLARTPREMLPIAYLGGFPTHYGFFPHKLNGDIR